MARGQKLYWEAFTSLMARRTRSDDKMLILYTSPSNGEWLVFAIETDIAKEPTKDASLARMLESHSHQVLEPQPTLEEALASAERYAKWWSRTRAVNSECGCDSIEDAALAAGE